MPIEARLFDAAGQDRAVELEDHAVADLSQDEILWVDVRALDEEDRTRLAAIYAWERETLDDLGQELGRARIRIHSTYVHLTVEAVVCAEELAVSEIDLLVGRDFVVSVHQGDVPALDAMDEEYRGDSRLGKLAASQFMAMLVDRILGDYLACVEDIERQIDRLDELALRARGGDLLVPIIRLRRRIALLRRTLAPHQAAFEPLARPDFELHEELGQPWPGLIDRLRQTIAATENARQLLLGAFDVLMARTSQRSNRAIQTLTVVSAMFLPAAVLAGIMGMNFRLAFFDDPAGFAIVVAIMVIVALGILVLARARDWI